MRWRPLACLAAPLVLCAAPAPTGAWNATAARIGESSARVREAASQLRTAAGRIRSGALRRSTQDGLDPKTCISHRAGLNAAQRTRIVQELVDAGLAEPADGAKFPGGLVSGIFPPVEHEDSGCPTLPQPLEAAPGSGQGGHHSYPGGLAIHEAFNLASARSLSVNYRERYGPGVAIDEDIVIAAPVWHDWAKTIVFQWNADGTEFEELNLGGGASKTGAHHILSLAETMKRDLPPDFIVAQASSHAAPVLGNEGKVVAWLRAAAIIAQVDPVARGYLMRDQAADFHIARLRIEDSIHNLSDADFVVSIPAVAIADGLLQQLAPEFGFGQSGPGVYLTGYRHPALSRLTAERILMVYTQRGLAGVREEVRRALGGGP